jgi:chitinase
MNDLLINTNSYHLKCNTKHISFLELLSESYTKSAEQVSAEKPSMTVMAYYVPSQTYSLEQIPFEKLTHIIFSFTEVIDNKMQFVEPEFDQNLKDLVAYKKQYPHLKVMIACGGWMGCAGFSDMAFDDDLRKGFVESTIDFVNHYDLDGVDMDWEYPGLPGAGNMHRKEDTKNFTSLMRELREGLDATGKKHTLTFASAGWDRYYDFIETNEVMKYADYMNVMTYDLTTAAVPYTAHHTNFGRFEMEDIKGHPAHDELLKQDPNFKPRSGTNCNWWCILRKGLGRGSSHE